MQLNVEKEENEDSNDDGYLSSAPWSADDYSDEEVFHPDYDDEDELKTIKKTS